MKNGEVKYMNTAQKILHQEMKHKFVLQRLQSMGVQRSQDGRPLHDLSYDDLKVELVLASFREIDVQTDSGKWF